MVDEHGRQPGRSDQWRYAVCAWFREMVPSPFMTDFVADGQTRRLTSMERRMSIRIIMLTGEGRLCELGQGRPVRARLPEGARLDGRLSRHRCYALPEGSEPRLLAKSGPLFICRRDHRPVRLQSIGRREVRPVQEYVGPGTGKEEGRVTAHETAVPVPARWA